MSAVILAVDDSETMRNYVKQTLELGGYEVLLASDGLDGLEKYGTRPVQAVVTDINMPVMDGLTFIRELRKLDRTVPILTLTTESEDAMKRQGSQAGANGWVVKPFRPAQFLDIVRQLLE